MRLVGVLIVVLLGCAYARQPYHGYQIVRTAPLTATNIHYARHLETQPHVELASRPRIGRSMNILTSPEHVNDLHRSLHEAGMHSATIVKDVSKIVEKERAEIEEIKKHEDRSSKAASFDRYMTFTEILDYLYEVENTYPGIANVTNIATSYEGREVAALKISTGPGKKAIWIDCGIHAREWMSPPVCLKVITEVMARPELQDLLDWYVLPVGNPDGYDYTWTGARFWRKTRSPNTGSSCIGTDPNRNFDYMWNPSNSTNPCSETYPGTRPFSEPECDGIGQWLRTLGYPATVKLYLTVHSYGQVFYYPYGTRADPAPNAPELQICGDIGARAIEAVRGTVYQVYSESNPANFIYGAMDDYAYDQATIMYSYTIELPAGGTGFDPPPEDIQPVVNETWAGIEAMVHHLYG